MPPMFSKINPEPADVGNDQVPEILPYSVLDRVMEVHAAFEYRQQLP